MPKKRKGFARTYRFSSEILRKLMEIQEKRNFPSQILALEKIIAEAHQSLQVQEKPPAPSEDLIELEEAKKEIERLKEILRKETECFSRFEHEGRLLCAKNAPKTIELSTEKICIACRFRVTKEQIAKELPQIQYYYTCGATESFDQKQGIMRLFCKNENCPADLRGRWHTAEACKQKGCPFLKTVLFKKKKK